MVHFVTLARWDYSHIPFQINIECCGRAEEGGKKRRGGFEKKPTFNKPLSRCNPSSFTSAFILRKPESSYVCVYVCVYAGQVVVVYVHLLHDAWAVIDGGRTTGKVIRVGP